MTSTGRGGGGPQGEEGSWPSKGRGLPGEGQHVPRPPQGRREGTAVPGEAAKPGACPAGAVGRAGAPAAPRPACVRLPPGAVEGRPGEACLPGCELEQARRTGRPPNESQVGHTSQARRAAPRL